MSKYLIVVDTNVLHADPLLRGDVSKKLQTASNLLPAEIVVPEVVKDELAGHYRRHLEGKRDEIAKLQTELARLGITGIEPATSDLDRRCADAVNTYEAQLTSRLNELGWTIAQYPDVSHRDVARRAIERRRPFDEKGRGYRDTLVWHTVRDVILASETPILLISGDGDFRGPTGQVHKHLAADLDPNGGSEMVTLLQSLPALYEGYIVTVPEWTPRTATRFA